MPRHPPYALLALLPRTLVILFDTNTKQTTTSTTVLYKMLKIEILLKPASGGGDEGVRTPDP
jgi:hypothetical protein